MAIRIPDPCVMTIFGASGDLTHRKLIPSLFNLFCDGQLPANFAVMGFARKPKTDEVFREECRKSVAEFSRFKPLDEAKWAEFAPLLHYLQADYGTPEDYDKLAEAQAQLDANHGTAGNRLYYIATPPEVYPTIIERLGSCPLCRTSALNGWTRQSPVLSIEDYAAMLYDCGAQDMVVFEKIYPHILENADAKVRQPG